LAPRFVVRWYLRVTVSLSSWRIYRGYSVRMADRNTFVSSRSSTKWRSSHFEVRNTEASASRPSAGRERLRCIYGVIDRPPGQGPHPALGRISCIFRGPSVPAFGLVESDNRCPREKCGVQCMLECNSPISANSAKIGPLDGV